MCNFNPFLGNVLVHYRIVNLGSYRYSISVMGYYRFTAGLPHTVWECVPPAVTVRGLQVTESTVLYLLCLVQHRQQHSTTSHGHQCVYTISRRLCMFSVCMCVRTRARVCVCVAGCARPCPWGLLSWFNSAPLGWTQSDSWGPMKAAVQQCCRSTAGRYLVFR